MRVVGADAFRGGWVAVSLVDGRLGRVWTDVGLDLVLAGEPVSTVVGVDIPLGGTPSSWRTADVEAKRVLRAQHPRVFMVPPRPVWTAPTYAEAAQRCELLTGKRISIQTYGLFPKMLQAERYRDQDRHELYEIHPELVFAALAGGPVADNKKTPAGERVRRSLLRSAGITVPAVRAAPVNDVLDAVAVAIAAHRIALGETRHVPAVADQFDHRGRPILIWY
jgi:predicted RNase H-like nuclease